MSSISVTEKSRTDGQYNDHHEPATTTTTTTSSLPAHNSLKTHKMATPAPTSSRSTPVPVFSTLPTTVPHDLIPPNAQWMQSRAMPDTIHPSTWTETSSTGPFPFTTLISYRLPQSGAEVTWESRRYRRQLEQHCGANLPAEVAGKRAALQRSWHNRLLRVHLKRWSWWAVLWFNVGSHTLLYAAICLFIPYFNTGDGIYQENTGWSSNVLAAAFWLAASVFEIAAMVSAKPSGKWYQVPRPLLPSNQKKVDPRVYDVAYVDEPTAAVRVTGILRRMDFWITAIRFVAYLAFVVATIAFSGAFDPLSRAEQGGAVIFPGILTGVLLFIANYLSMAEACHQWLPWKRGAAASSVRYLDWWICALSMFASVCMVAYYMDLIWQPDLLDQRQGPAYPYTVKAFFFTVSDWLQAVEQGEEFYYEKATPVVPAAAAPMAAYAAKGAPPVPSRPGTLAVDDTTDYEHRLAIQSPRSAHQQVETA